MVELAGEHDFRTSERELAATLFQLLEVNRLIVVDISAATFIDSTTIRVLATAARLAHDDGKRVRLDVGGSGWDGKLRLLGLGSLFDLALSREDALRLDA